MEVRDPVHGSIHILDEEQDILRHDFFQRLRGIKQLGLSEYVFPGATHSRLIHSIGVMHVADKAFNILFKEKVQLADFKKLKETFKLAALLHDVGHAPLSHATETVMPKLSELKIPNEFLSVKDRLNDRQATHEDYTIKSIADSSFAEAFSKVEKNFGVDRKCIADLIVGHTHNPDYFTINQVNYFPILAQLVSSELDCDRMDYLLRDSYFCGVSYGQFDLDWMIDNLRVCIIDNTATLGITERAVSTFDDFLLSRYHMFLMVYFHYRSVCLENLLQKYFQTSKEYFIPASIEAYLDHDDHFLMKVMRRSKNPYAQSVVKNEIPTKIYESFSKDQHAVLNNVENYLIDQKIEYIKNSSSSRLSKYYTGDHEAKRVSFMVERKLYGNKIKYFDIANSTDLFSKYSQTHSVNRLHCDIEKLSQNQQKEIIKLISL